MACFVVKDSAGQKLAYVYFEHEAGRRSAASLLARDPQAAATTRVGADTSFCTDHPRRSRRLQAHIHARDSRSDKNMSRRCNDIS